MLYDLHIHTCLSPCANDDMTPANVAGMAKLAGAQLIAVADHNSALNLPAVATACKAYGLQHLPAIEVNTQEEIHLLCYFKTVQNALDMGEILYNALPSFPYDQNIWGKQLVCDENDVVLQTVPKLLTSAVDMNIYEVKKTCEALGGIAVPAHANKDSYSLLSVLGFCPDDLPFKVVELTQPEQYTQLVQKQFLPEGCEVLTSSDAHQLPDIAENLHILSTNSVLKSLF